MRRVVHVLGSLAARHGGPARAIPALCGSLAALGDDVRVVALDFGSRFGPRVELPAGVPIARVPTRSLLVPGAFHSPGLRRTLRAILSEVEGVVVHEHGMWLAHNHATVRVARELRVPRVLSPRGMLAPWSLSYRRWRKNLAWWLYAARDTRAADVLHATSRLEARDLRRLGLSQPIAVVPNGVELPAPSLLRPGRGPRTALFLSRLHPVKGLPLLIEAWAALRPAGWHLEIVGPDEQGHRAKLEDMVRSHALGDVVGFRDSVSDRDKWDHYRRASLFVLPSYSESFGVVVAEALACGVPVITTCETPWEVLGTEGCGWWVRCDLPSLREALDSALSLPGEELRAMGRRGRELVERRYTWPAIARELGSVYRWMLAQGPEPSCLFEDRRTSQERTLR